VTRAAKGVGKEIAKEFATAGYSVMLNDVTERDLKRAARETLSSLTSSMITGDHTNHVSYFAGDISKEEVSISLIEETIKRFGRIDVLINNAIISQQSIASQSYEMSATAPRANSDPGTNKFSSFFTIEEYGIADTTIKGIYFCIRELVRQLLIDSSLNSYRPTKKYGNRKDDIHNIKKVDCSIINISSCYNSIPSSLADAYTFSQSGIDPFTSSRSSIKSLTESIALQLADKGIRVNAIAPGIIDSDIDDEVMKDKEMKDHVEKTIPFQRIGQASEVAKVALFLVSEASSYVTGTMIYSDGGLSLRDPKSH
jgi:NAD(P)-dependent dehydrogenase (short-subunit alcohol dehydrogenase family)